MMTNARWIGIGMLLCGVAGCAATWDEITSRERDFRYISGINKPHPLEVIQRSDDGARRAQAFGELKEPLGNGGNAEDQKAYLDILGAAAKTDREPLCRLTAVRTLGKFKDPRAARILEDIYRLPVRRPGVQDNGEVLPFNADINSMIRKESLVALGNTRDPQAIDTLVRVARGPGPEMVADLNDRHQTQDEKLVAIKALRHYPQQQAMDALVFIMRTEKDVALRDGALASLEQITNKKWPNERQAWQTDDVRPLPGLAAGDNMIQRVGAWFQKKD